MKLAEPIRIRNMEMKNRIVMAPMITVFPLRSKQSRDFYVERCKGGVGAITLTAINLDVINSDRFISGLQEWVIKPVHEYGVKIAPELWQGNVYPNISIKGRVQEWIAPSAGTPMGAKVTAAAMQAPAECYCREATISEIQDIVDKFGKAAARAIAAGFDYINVHAAHGNNITDQFFSPLDNRRNDMYGGDLARRMRFGIEVAKSIRAAISDYPFFWRLSAEHGLPGGHTLSEAVEYAAELVKAGVDIIEVSYGHEEMYQSAPIRPMTVTPRQDEPMGTFVPYAEAFKRRLSVPILAVGRIHSPDVAEEILSQGKADMIGIGRQLLADPYWPQKAITGKAEDIRPCQCCNTCLRQFIESQSPIICVINPALGKEEEYTIKPAGKVKRVLVIGGGPAGMEAALIAAQRGHQVTLVEKGDKLGGTLNLMAKLPHKLYTNNLVKYFIRQIEKAGVQVRLNKEATAKLIEEMRPDVVIVATGSITSMPDIPGLQKGNAVTAVDILSGRSEAGDKVAVIGGGLVGCDIAEFLATRGKKVTMLRRGPVIADEMGLFDRQFTSYKLGAKGVIMMTGVKYGEVTEEGLTVTDKWGRNFTIEADTIVIAAGSVPDDSLARQLEGKVPELYSIGDCVEPRKVIDAIREGASAGYKI